ncbi:diaminopimelate epimerase [Virgisporangium aliadipatigenens]|uniref:Diaminopimelate epimerase n=1 Tax=Virgisporangium aliadipatigenens TaxID=741659 RepID=A0A8J4DPH6_9ACTN|nr:diaminopimelate epimerase [Virgisporangium aliadipatigenens]GIJ45940.1 diaminopimelate epimerase [Virgisporangium aliadipatigenens]
MRFTKGHGTGNDFVILPDLDGALDLTPERVAALCDRRRGIGADGVLRVVRSAAATDAPEGPEFFMDYRNSDGSLAEMCGNGARVFVRYLLEQGLAGGSKLEFGSRAGVITAVADGDEIAVAMRRPAIVGQSSAMLGALQLAGQAVDIGNPHLVCRVPDVDIVDLRDAPRFDAAFFPAGVNVEVISGDASLTRMRVYERGSGETLSCGTGACAVAAVVLGGADGTVPVEVPGGRLTITIEPDRCWLAGPAVLVAHGDVLI